MKKLHVDDGSGFRAATIDEILEGARAALAQKVRRGTSMASPKLATDYLAMRLGDRGCEVFTVMFLDARHRLIECVEMFRGTVDGASVHPREVVKEALQRNAAAVILCHNHPSGVAEPSHADEIITRRLRDALSLIDVRVVDHILGGFYSVTTAAQMRQSLGFHCINREHRIR